MFKRVAAGLLLVASTVAPLVSQLETPTRQAALEAPGQPLAPEKQPETPLPPATTKIEFSKTKPPTGLSPVASSPEQAPAPAVKPAPVPVKPPHQAVADAYTDLSYVRAEDQPFTRYLDLGNLVGDQEAFQRYLGVLSCHINSLSKVADLKAPTLVKGYLLRFDLRDYDWDPKVYEQLAVNDPYYHIKVQIVPESMQKDTAKNGEAKKADAKKQDGKQEDKKDLLAPWLFNDEQGKTRLSRLFEATGSTTIVMRADWFFNQTAVQEGRTVGYYGLLGVKKIEDFEALVRFDRKLAKDLERIRVVVFSGITLEPRRVELTRSTTGDYWRTFDSAEAVGKKNPLVFLDDDFEFDASEQFGHLPNELPAWWLGDGKHVRQDKAPDNVVGGDALSAADRSGRGNDRRLHINISCIRCHYRGTDSGIRTLDPAPISKILAADYVKLRELTSKYFAPIDARTKADRLVYEEVVKKASGMGTKDYAKAYDEFWIRYETARVGLKRAAADLGVEPEALQAALERQEKILGYVHPALSILQSGGEIGIIQFQEVYSLAQAVLRGVQP